MDSYKKHWSKQSDKAVVNSQHWSLEGTSTFCLNEKLGSAVNTKKVKKKIDLNNVLKTNEPKQLQYLKISTILVHL